MSVFKFDHLSLDLLQDIRNIFKLAPAGASMELMFPHRDEHPMGKASQFYVLPKAFEIPKTFSVEQLIRQAMEPVCPEVHKDFEELPDTAIAAGDIEQGFWKFVSMEVNYETGYISATIKKI